MKVLGNAKRRWAVVQFPGSNCDADAFKAFQELEGITPVMHWHEDPLPKNTYEVVALPGGFSYGDYLRAGAIAKISPALSTLEEVVDSGTHVIGICNGFQILLETRLLPGFLQVNSHLKFVSQNVDCEISAAAFPWFSEKDKGKTVRYPIAHRFGNYQVSPMDRLEVQPALKYKNDVNGSFQQIAGIYRKLGKGSIFGLMPHPERASFSALRLSDGLSMWKTAWESLQ